MAHIKKYWLIYLLLVIILILVAYQMKWFGNKTKLFADGGRVYSNQKLDELKRITGNNNLPVKLPVACEKWIDASINDPHLHKYWQWCVWALNRNY